MDPFSGADRMHVDGGDGSYLNAAAAAAVRAAAPPHDAYLEDMVRLELLTPQNPELASLMPMPAMANLPASLHSPPMHSPPHRPALGFGAEQVGAAPSPFVRATQSMPSTPQQRPLDLSAISRSPLNLPVDNVGFELSPALQHDLRVGCSRSGRRTRHSEVDVDQLVRRVVEEIRSFARRKKEMVRVAKKEIQTLYNDDLDAIQKSRLRSRREAEVSRVKVREEDQALRQALRWMIANTEIRHPDSCQCRVNGGFAS